MPCNSGARKRSIEAIMEWRDPGIVIMVRKHGESSAIVGLLTRENGRHVGLVRGGQSRRRQGVLQVGNLVSASWRARLSEHLGSYTLEPLRDFAALIMDDPLRLKAACAAAALLNTALAERDPHPDLYDASLNLMENLAAAPDAGTMTAPAAYVRWEVVLLRCLGFGLDLEACAATGRRDDLIYVSPKTGRAVSRDAGRPYHDRLLSLPPFLVDPDAAPQVEDIRKGLSLTGTFLERHHFAAEGRRQPAARDRFVAAL